MYEDVLSLTPSTVCYVVLYQQTVASEINKCRRRVQTHTESTLFATSQLLLGEPIWPPVYCPATDKGRHILCPTPSRNGLGVAGKHGHDAHGRVSAQLRQPRTDGRMSLSEKRFSRLHHRCNVTCLHHWY